MSAVSGPGVTAIMTIAVAAFAVSLLFGRLAIGQGFRLVLGCFILTASAEIAQSVTGSVSHRQFDAEPPELADVQPIDLPPLGPEPPTPVQDGNPFDPYAGVKSIH